MLIGELLQEYFHCNQFIKRSGYAYLRNKLFFWIMRLIPKTLLSVWWLKFIKTSILSTVAVLSSIKTFNKLLLVSKELIDYDMQTLAFVWWSFYFSYCWMRVVLSISEIWKTKKKNLLNPTLDGGGHIVPPPSILCSGALNLDLKSPRFWYNSYFIVTM